MVNITNLVNFRWPKTSQNLPVIFHVFCGGRIPGLKVPGLFHYGISSSGLGGVLYMKVTKLQGVKLGSPPLQVTMNRRSWVYK